MTPEELLALILATRQANPGPKRPTTPAPSEGGRAAPTPAQVAALAGDHTAAALGMPVGPPNAQWSVQPGDRPVDPEMLRAYAGGTEYLPPGDYVAVEPPPPAPPAPSGPNARATLPASPPPRPAPQVQYSQPADMTFVRPPNPPAPSDRGQVVTDYGPSRHPVLRAIDALLGR